MFHGFRRDGLGFNMEMRVLRASLSRRERVGGEGVGKNPVAQFGDGAWSANGSKLNGSWAMNR